MLENGTITVDEALALLENLSNSSSDSKQGESTVDEMNTETSNQESKSESSENQDSQKQESKNGSSENQDSQNKNLKMRALKIKTHKSKNLKMRALKIKIHQKIKTPKTKNPQSKMDPRVSLLRIQVLLRIISNLQMSSSKIFERTSHMLVSDSCNLCKQRFKR